MTNSKEVNAYTGDEHRHLHPCRPTWKVGLRRRKHDEGMKQLGLSKGIEGVDWDLTKAEHIDSEYLRRAPRIVHAATTEIGKLISSKTVSS